MTADGPWVPLSQVHLQQPNIPVSLTPSEEVELSCTPKHPFCGSLHSVCFQRRLLCHDPGRTPALGTLGIIREGCQGAQRALTSSHGGSTGACLKMSPEGQLESARRANIRARLTFMTFILTFYFETILNCNVPPTKKIPFRVKKKKKSNVM